MKFKYPISKANTAIIFIEFQGEWLNEDGVLYQRLVEDKKAFRQAVFNAGKVLNAARKSNWQIVHAGLSFNNDPDYLLFAKGKGVMGLRAAIPAAGTWVGKSTEFVAPFTPQQNEFVTLGRSGGSVLTNSNLDPFLRNNHIDTLIIMGFATHVCVESTLRDAHDRGLNVYVVTDASAAFTAEQDQYFEKHILHHFGAGIKADAFVSLLKNHEE